MPLALGLLQAHTGPALLRLAAPASLKHFRWFSGRTAAAAKKAVESLELQPVGDTDLLLPKDIAAEFEAFTVPDKHSYALVAGNDGILPLPPGAGRCVSAEPSVARAVDRQGQRRSGTQPPSVFR